MNLKPVREGIFSETNKILGFLMISGLGKEAELTCFCKNCADVEQFSKYDSQKHRTIALTNQKIKMHILFCDECGKIVGGAEERVRMITNHNPNLPYTSQAKSDLR
jgi:hypothetical protein